MRARRHARLATNILANVGGQVGLLILGVVAVKLLFNHLGPDALGMVLFVQTINVLLAGVLDLGVPSITVREVAAHATDDPGYASDVVRTASSLYWAAFAAAAAAMVLTAPWIASHWVHLTSMDVASATTVLQILGVAALTVLPRLLYTSVCRGLQRMVVNNVVDLMAGIMQQLGIVIILARGGDLFAVVRWMALTYVIALAVYVVVVARFLSLISIVPGWSSRVIRRNAQFSAHMTLISVLSVIHTYIDKLAVSKLLSVASLGWYSFANSVVARGALVTNAIADAAYPSFSELFKQREVAAMAAQYRKLQDVVCYLAVPMYAGVTYLSLPLFTAVFGRSTAQALLVPVAILCLGYWANGTLSVVYVYSLAVGKPQLTSRLSFQAALITVPVTIASVAWFGLAGASFGYLSYHIFFYLAGIPVYCRECLQIPPSRWYAHISKVLTLAAATYGCGWLAADWVGGLRLSSLALAFTGATLVFALVAYRLVDPELRVMMVSLVSHGRHGWLSHAA